MKKGLVVVIRATLFTLIVNPNNLYAETIINSKTDCENSFKPYIYDDIEKLTTEFKSKMCNKAKDFEQNTGIPIVIGLFQDGYHSTRTQTLKSVVGNIGVNQNNAVYLTAIINEQTVYLTQSQNGHTNYLLNIEDLMSTTTKNDIQTLYSERNIEGAIEYSQDKIINNVKESYKSELEVAEKLGLHQAINISSDKDTQEVIASEYIFFSKNVIGSFIIGLLTATFIFLIGISINKSKRKKQDEVNKQKKIAIGKERKESEKLLQKGSIDTELELLKRNSKNE